jgi:hypothetical protein
MTIDIISFTDEQYSALTANQLQEVTAAQTKKDRMTSALAEKKRKEKFRLLKNGIFRSKIYAQLCAEWDEAYQTELDRLKEQLLFFLRFSTKVEVPTDNPYAIDYSLSYEERYVVVRDYYLATYLDDMERWTEFKKDTVAPNYLGEYYVTLHDYLLEKIEK